MALEFMSGRGYYNKVIARVPSQRKVLRTDTADIILFTNRIVNNG